MGMSMIAAVAAPFRAPPGSAGRSASRHVVNQVRADEVAVILTFGR